MILQIFQGLENFHLFLDWLVYHGNFEIILD